MASVRIALRSAPAKKVLPTPYQPGNSFIIQPESYGATVDEGFIVVGQLAKILESFVWLWNGLRCREDA